MRRRRSQANGTANRFAVRTVPNDAARVLVTITGDRRALWGVDLDAFNAALRATIENPAGAIVRVKPPAHATDESIARIRAALDSLGAVVRVLPKEKGDAPVVHTRESTTAKSARDVVLDMASAHPPEVAALLTVVMDEAGL